MEEINEEQEVLESLFPDAQVIKEHYQYQGIVRVLYALANLLLWGVMAGALALLIYYYVSISPMKLDIKNNRALAYSNQAELRRMQETLDDLLVVLSSSEGTQQPVTASQ